MDSFISNQDLLFIVDCSQYIYIFSNMCSIVLQLDINLLKVLFYWFILNLVGSLLFFYLIFFCVRINKYKLVSFYNKYFNGFKGGIFLIINFCKFVVFQFYFHNKHYYKHFFFNNLMFILLLLPTILTILYIVLTASFCRTFSYIILFFILIFFVVVLRFIFFVFIIFAFDYSCYNSYGFNKLRMFYTIVIIFKMSIFLFFLKNQVKNIFNNLFSLLFSKYVYYLFHIFSILVIELSLVIKFKLNLYLNILKICLIYMYYTIKESSFKVYIMFIVFFVLPAVELLVIIIRLFYSAFYVEASCIDPTDITDMKILKRAVFGSGPTYDQIRTYQIFSSNERFLLYWYLAAYRIILFKWNGYTEVELERICLESLDRDVMYGIVDAGKHHFTDYTPDWRPPVNYLEWPVQRHKWMDYGPSLIRQRNYEPATSIIYYGGMFWLFKACLPVFKGLFEVWKSNLRGDDGRGIGGNDDNNEGYDSADVDSDDEGSDSGLDV